MIAIRCSSCGLWINEKTDSNRIPNAECKLPSFQRHGYSFTVKFNNLSPTGFSPITTHFCKVCLINCLITELNTIKKDGNR